MVLAACRPMKHPKTGVYQFRKAVPLALRSLIGKTEVKRSLHTKDPTLARQLHAEVAAEVDREWAEAQAAGSGHGVSAGQTMCDSQGVQRSELLLEAFAVPPVSHGPEKELAAQRRRPGSLPTLTKPIEPKASLPSCRKAESLKGLVEGWWTEAKALGRKPSTYESYSATTAAFVAFLGHDDANRVTPEDVIRFKDHRLASVNPRTGKPISPKAVKDSDLAGLRAVFDWAVINRKMGINPAKGITLKLGKVARKRASKGLTDAEAQTLLHHAWAYQRGAAEHPKTAAAKRWAPWLCAYTGARVGEIVQLPRQDIRLEEGVWIITITPEAGTVKTNEAREVPLRDHLIEMGFPEFVRSSSEGHLFLNVPVVTTEERVTGQRRTVKNRVTEFAREVVKDPNVQPNHGWRHRFKTIARNVGMDPGVRDAIQGHDSGSVAESYGDVTVDAKVAAIAKLPRFDV
ncbi:DUF6538 domain-containing protein [Xanthobacter sp. ZOL 2024]